MYLHVLNVLLVTLYCDTTLSMDSGGFQEIENFVHAETCDASILDTVSGTAGQEQK